MKMQLAYATFPLEAYPILVEALHVHTRQVVWSTRIEAPSEGQPTPVYIPPLARQLGHPVAIRTTWGNGDVRISEPPPDDDTPPWDEAPPLLTQ